MCRGWAILLLSVVGCTAKMRPEPLASPLPSGVSNGRADLDDDGRDECWTSEVSVGSGASSITLELQHPCGSAPTTLYTMAASEDFLAHTGLPDSIAREPQLIGGIVELLYGPGHLVAGDAIDASFRWLLDKSSPWMVGPPRSPQSQVVVRREPAEAVAYHAHNHGPLRRVAVCAEMAVWATFHGIALHDTRRDESRWIYISNQAEKLRRPSIGEVRCEADGTLAVETSAQALRFPIRRSSYP
jgi:hypothetical protein